MKQKKELTDTFEEPYGVISQRGIVILSEPANTNYISLFKPPSSNIFTKIKRIYRDLLDWTAPEPDYFLKIRLSSPKITLEGTGSINPKNTSISELVTNIETGLVNMLNHHPSFLNEKKPIGIYVESEVWAPVANKLLEKYGKV